MNEECAILCNDLLAPLTGGKEFNVVPLVNLTFTYYVLSSSSHSQFVTSATADLPIVSPPPTQINKCALDIICETAMGHSLGAQQSSESEYVKAVDEASELVNKRITSPWLWNDLIYYLSPQGAR